MKFSCILHLSVICLLLISCKGDYQLRTRCSGCVPPCVILTVDRAPYFHKRDNTSKPIEDIIPWTPNRTEDIELSKYDGFIPEFIRIIKRRNAFLENCTIGLKIEAKDDVGMRLENGTWTGIIGNVIQGSSQLAAAPILKKAPQNSALKFCKPWATVSLTLVVKYDSNISSLEDALNSNVNFSVVVPSTEYESLSSHEHNAKLARLYNSLYIKNSSHPNTIEDGLEMVRREKTVLVLNDLDAAFHVNRRDHDLKIVGGRFITIGQYAFAVAPSASSSDQCNRIDAAVETMEEDGTMKKLKEKWFRLSNGSASRTEILFSYFIFTVFTTFIIVT